MTRRQVRHADFSPLKNKSVCQTAVFQATLIRKDCGLASVRRTPKKMKNIRSRFSRPVYGWAIYDWANSAFATTVMAGFFPIFFKGYWSAGTDVNVSSAQLAFGNSIASGLVFLLAPFLGAIADRGSAKKRFLITFAYLGAAMTAGLFWVEKGDWQMAIWVYVLGVVGFSGANIFYDSMITDIAAEDDVDVVSGFGYSLGYLGGGLLFLINVLMTQMPEAFGIPDAATAVRLSFLSVALWWGGFTIFTIFWVPEKRSARPKGAWQAVVDGLRQLNETRLKIKRLRVIGIFLLAYWLYIDGVHTIIRMAVDYGKSLGFEDGNLIVALLVVQFVGFPAAIIYSRFGQKWDVRKAIFLAIGAYVIITLWGVFMTNIVEFYAIAVMVGLFQGGIQALSRSYFSRLIPKGQAGEFFGFYNMVGKFGAIFGPFLMGVVGLFVKNVMVKGGESAEQLLAISNTASRWSIGSLLILLISGMLFLWFVDEEKGQQQIAGFGENLPRE